MVECLAPLVKSRSYTSLSRAKEDGPISKLKDGDLIELNSETGVLRTDVDLNNRPSKTVSLDKTQGGFGRELFQFSEAVKLR